MKTNRGSDPGRANLTRRAGVLSTLVIAASLALLLPSRVALAQTQYTFTKIADTTQYPAANLGAIQCVGVSNTGMVVVAAAGGVWRGDGQSFVPVSSNVNSICPSINDLNEIAYTTVTTPFMNLVRNSNGTETILVQYTTSSGTLYLPSLSHSGSAVYQTLDGIYIAPGGIPVVTITNNPELSNYLTGSMNDNLVVAFNAYNSITSQWGIYRGASLPFVEGGGPVIETLSLGRPVINNAGTIAFAGSDSSNNVGVFKTDDGVAFTYIGWGGLQPGHDRISMNNNGTVAFDGAAGAGVNIALFVGNAAPASPVIKAGDRLDGSVVAGLFMYEESLNDSGQLAFWAQLEDGRIGVYRANPNHPPVASDGSISVMAGAASQGTLAATDPDGNSLLYSVVTNGTKGTVVVTDASTGAYTYTANVGSSGQDTFTFKANDGFVDSNTAAMTVAITPPCAADISATVSVSAGSLKLNRKTGRYTQSLTLKNSDGAVPGSVSLALDSLSSNATLFNGVGTTSCATPSGSPYINVDVGSDSVFTSRERATVTLEFLNPSGQPVTYTPRVLAGANP